MTIVPNSVQPETEHEIDVSPAPAPSEPEWQPEGEWQPAPEPEAPLLEHPMERPYCGRKAWKRRRAFWARPRAWARTTTTGKSGSIKRPGREESPMTRSAHGLATSATHGCSKGSTGRRL